MQLETRKITNGFILTVEGEEKFFPTLPFESSLLEFVTKAEEKQEELNAPPKFRVCINNGEVYQDRRIAAIRAIRNVSRCGLKEGKDIVDNGRETLIAENLNERDAQYLKGALEACGADAFAENMKIPMESRFKRFPMTTMI